MTRKRLAVMIGTSIAVILVLVAALAVHDARTERARDARIDALIREGELVLQRDPLIVAVPHPPDPEFDTSDLGVRTSYEPIESLDDPGVAELLDRVQVAIDHPFTGDRTITKISLLGHDDDESIAVVVTDGNRPEGFRQPERNMSYRNRAVYTMGGASSNVVEVHRDDTRTLVEPPDSFDELERFSFGLATGGSPDRLHLGTVSSDVAVLQYVVDGKSRWMVPIEGAVVIPGQVDDNTIVEVVLYDWNGQVIHQRKTTPLEG